MSRELMKTGAFIVVALVLAAAANWIEPEAVTPTALSDEGEPLFPKFRDVMAVKAIEVIAYNETEAVANPLKVEFRQGRWILPSHNDYPAEAADRLDKTAGALLDLHKDIVVSDLVEDHGNYGVIDPLDTKVASLTGRGKRVTLRDGAGEILADLILGKPVEGHTGYRYVRLPQHRRVYGVKTEADPSAKFEDWVEGNLLRLSSSRISKITVNSYSVDETIGRVRNMQRVEATRDGQQWKIAGTRQVSKSAAAAAATALSSIRIVGARPKPRPLAEQLREGRLQMTLEAVMSLRQRGFFLTPSGRLMANEGEEIVETNRGLTYTLRFGEIVSSGLGAERSGAGDSEKADTGEQNRYVLVTVNQDPAKNGTERLARNLNRKFADWYYVISGSDFAKIRMGL